MPSQADITRPQVRGKSFSLGDEKLLVRGVTYGTFRPQADGTDLPARSTVTDDLDAMAAIGVNAVRTYTPPPSWMLDEALARGIRVLVGLPWEQHVAFLDSRSSARAITDRVRAAASSCAGHPAVLGYAVGNEIPAPIARWHGRHRTEKFIERLYSAVKAEDPEGLVTYVNYPSTEYLQLEFLDFACFNVYLETQRSLEAYAMRLHNIVGDRPLLLAEIGLDSRRNGEDAQAHTLEWQVDTAFDMGCAGAFVFAWTDEWHRGGFDIEDWDFGLVDRERRPKPALRAVERAFTDDAVSRDRDWPRISVVVCTYNGERWLPGCFDALERVDYPNWEVLVVSDGSADRTDELTEARGLRLIAAESNGGLGAARNLGMREATGEIVAYLDDDARPEPDWLRHLALAFDRTSHAAIGGPNLPPPSDSPVAQCVARSPGGPVHVLLNDDLAEHIPGCNTAVRAEALRAVDGFDPRYRIAGDDVDLCWRLQREGYTVGFSPAAAVWHHRRSSVRAYVKQQFEYGKAEGLLHKKWPERYNRLGHLSWAGRVYGHGTGQAKAARRSKVHYGSWGSRLFQSIYSPPSGVLRWLPALPEWYLLLSAIGAIGLLGLQWHPLLAAVPVFAAGVVAVLAAAVAGTRPALASWRSRPLATRLGMAVLTAALHVLQPLARLSGRLRGGVTPWRRHCRRDYALPLPRRKTAWSETWVAPDRWLGTVEARLQVTCHAVARGGDADRWDLQVRGGPLGVARLIFALEEHGGGRQLARFRWWPHYSRAAILLVGTFAALSLAALVDGAVVMFATLGAIALALTAVAVRDCAGAAGAVVRALEEPLREPPYAVIAEPVPASSPARRHDPQVQPPGQPVEVAGAHVEHASDGYS